MKMKIIIALIFFISSLTVAQQNTFNKQVELQKFIERRGKVEEISQNIYKLTYRDGSQRVFNFNPATNQHTYTEGFDTTIINIWEIDTTLYAHIFKFWQRVDLANGVLEPVPIEDINKNGQVELYGRTRYTWPLGGQVDIIEQDTNGEFHTVYSYDSTSIYVKGVHGLNSDGIKEVYLHSPDFNNGKFYKADSLSAFPTTFDFIFYYFTTAQINNMTFGDFDENRITDCAFSDDQIYIATFDRSINNFSEVAQFDVNDNSSRFAINDFDDDGKKEIVFGTMSGQVYVIETDDTNQYAIIWNGSAPSVNAYMITSTNDIDGNGKPELWIGGQDFDSGLSRFWCYEADGDNNYISVAEIELRYLVSLFALYLQSADIDKDGVEELIITIGNHLLVLKFKGNPNQHNYTLFYAKINEQTQPSALFLSPAIYDLNNDGKKDILLSMNIYPPPDISYILVQDTVTSVTKSDDRIFEKFDLSQNFPNPFNPATQFKVTVKEPSDVQITVYNTLGKEIKLLLSENLSAGEYTIHWDGKDNEGKYLTGGVYFIRMIAGDYHKTIKTILLK